MFSSSAHIADLKAQIAQLERLLEAERAENRHLLDCLLQKQNAAPMAQQPLKEPIPPVQFVHPYGGAATPEMIEAATQVAIDEEIAYLMAEENFSEDHARARAEQKFKGYKQ